MPLSNSLGVIACGHQLTAQAAADILREGGNAFDAIVAAHFAACVAEPILANIGGGGFMLAHPKDGDDCIYDFFAQTPKHWRDEKDKDFYPVQANFGNAVQEFHIGTGSIATPGSVRGMFAIHHDLCTLPMPVLMAPAIQAARNGVVIDALYDKLFKIIGRIYVDTAGARELFGSAKDKTIPVGEGDCIVQAELANTLEAIAREGDRLFYEGEVAQGMAAMCQEHGGHLCLDDLQDYQAIKRQPLETHYRGTHVITNSPPSSGGLLIAFALQLLESMNVKELARGSTEQLSLLAHVMDLTNQARHAAHLDENIHPAIEKILDRDYVALYQQKVKNHPACHRGTTHMSVIDNQGNMASLTASNGEGCGRIVPGTGIMLNNMLGEEDLNPEGFHNCPNDVRMTSMMAPTMLFSNSGRAIALGSGGSNRIRTAILQTLVNMVDYDCSLQAAVDAPRIHFERGFLNVEHGFDRDTNQDLGKLFPEHKIWDEMNLFFGGVHAVMRGSDSDGNSLSAGADPRRGGVTAIVK